MTISPLERLPWDSNHFGLAVARLSAPEADLDEVRAHLDQARHEGIALVYWPTCPDREVPGDLLADYHGRLVDRKATFRRELNVECPQAATSIHVVSYPAGHASPALRALGVAAGEFSRFRVDPFLPHDRFRALYETWMERATLRERADDVLVVLESDIADPLGMITVQLQDTVATIGLVAVAARARGRGVGKALMGAAHVWMTQHGARLSEVVTQLDNAPACRLYEATGYRLADMTPYYHFWPLGRPERYAWTSP